jgi:nucleoside-diphosphate-sugar epimerase
MNEPPIHARPPATVEQLEDQLSRPPAEVIEAVARCDSDIVLLGVGGKMGPTMARMARRAMDEAGLKRHVIGVSRFSDTGTMEKLNSWGVQTVRCDLVDREQVASLPDAGYVIHLAGFKFGASQSPEQLWAINCQAPLLVSQRYQHSQIVAFSTGSLYGLVEASSGGSREDDEPRPDGEYSMAALCRENIFRYYSRTLNIPMVVLRLNYATELRYGVLVDIAQQLLAANPVDISMTYFNVIWLSDANAMSLRAMEHCSSPARLLNITGPDTLRVPDVCQLMGEQLELTPETTGEQSELAFLSNASAAYPLLGHPAVDAETMIRWTSDWVGHGRENLGKPTKYQVRDGTY